MLPWMIGPKMFKYKRRIPLFQGRLVQNVCEKLDAVVPRTLGSKKVLNANPVFPRTGGPQFSDRQRVANVSLPVARCTVG